MIGQKNNRAVFLLVPNLYTAEAVRAILFVVVPGELYDLVFEDMPVLWNAMFLDHPVGGIPFLSRDEENFVICPAGKLGIVGIPHVDGQNGAFGKAVATGDVDLVDISFGYRGKHRQVTVVIKKKMEFHRSLGLPELGPVEQGDTEFDNRGIQAEQFVLESEL